MKDQLGKVLAGPFASFWPLVSRFIDGPVLSSYGTGVAALAALSGRFVGLGWLQAAKPQVRQHTSVEMPADAEPCLELGRAILEAQSTAHLNKLLDAGAMKFRYLAAPEGLMASIEQPQPSDFSEITSEDSPFVHFLGLQAAGLIEKTLRLSFQIIYAAGFAAFDATHQQGVLRALQVTPWSLHEGHIVPHELVKSSLIQFRGASALLSSLSAVVDANKVERWLSFALATAAYDGISETARLLAAASLTPSPDFSAVQPIDFAQMFEQAEEADRKVCERFANAPAGVPGDFWAPSVLRETQYVDTRGRRIIVQA